ncbi:hypothetical protein CGA21_07740 [Pseudomonas sp. PSB11]|nr:hypothetical protein [Pseudomonas sp. PSB11]
MAGVDATIQPAAPRSIATLFQAWATQAQRKLAREGLGGAVYVVTALAGVNLMAGFIQPSSA